MSRRGVLFVNLGTTAAPTPEATGRYLREFLNDPWVIDLPNPWRWLLVNWLIVPRRRHHSAENYRSIWLKEGSPLLVHSRRWRSEVQRCLDNQWVVSLGMRYGEPSIREALLELRAQGAEELYVLPLYPQFADSSTTTALEKVRTSLSEIAWRPRTVKSLPFFFDQPAFIESEAWLIQQALENFAADHLVLSYHGLPESHLRRRGEVASACRFDDSCCAQWGKSNRLCYRAQCLATTRLIVAALQAPALPASTAFQSRLGRSRWIGPSLVDEIDRLARAGRRRLLVACPSFVVDCLETLEEVGARAREHFLSQGGEDLRLVPSLNSSAAWVRSVPSLLNSDQWQIDLSPK